MLPKIYYILAIRERIGEYEHTFKHMFQAKNIQHARQQAYYFMYNYYGSENISKTLSHDHIFFNDNEVSLKLINVDGPITALDCASKFMSDAYIPDINEDKPSYPIEIKCNECGEQYTIGDGIHRRYSNRIVPDNMGGYRNDIYVCRYCKSSIPEYCELYFPRCSTDGSTNKCGQAGCLICALTV